MADARALLELLDSSGYECRALRETAQMPSTAYFTPGNGKYDAALASWPRVLAEPAEAHRHHQPKYRATDDTYDFEYTVVSAENFDHFLTILMRVDFNLWFHARHSGNSNLALDLDA